jgi:hypothetical protein
MEEGKEVAHPKHYNNGKIEVIDYITDQNLDFCLGNVVKYISRHKHKGRPYEDLLKALWYLFRELSTYNKGWKDAYELLVKEFNLDIAEDKNAQ